MRGGQDLPEAYYEFPLTIVVALRMSLAPMPHPLAELYSATDYELEFAVCIGKQGMNIPEEKAEEHIFGYTIFNDLTAEISFVRK